MPRPVKARGAANRSNAARGRAISLAQPDRRGGLGLGSAQKGGGPVRAAEALAQGLRREGMDGFTEGAAGTHLPGSSKAFPSLVPTFGLSLSEDFRKLLGCDQG